MTQTQKPVPSGAAKRRSRGDNPNPGSVLKRRIQVKLDEQDARHQVILNMLLARVNTLKANLSRLRARVKTLEEAP